MAWMWSLVVLLTEACDLLRNCRNCLRKWCCSVCFQWHLNLLTLFFFKEPPNLLCLMFKQKKLTALSFSENVHLIIFFSLSHLSPFFVDIADHLWNLRCKGVWSIHTKWQPQKPSDNPKDRLDMLASELEVRCPSCALSFCCQAFLHLPFCTNVNCLFSNIVDESSQKYLTLVGAELLKTQVLK